VYDEKLGGVISFVEFPDGPDTGPDQVMLKPVWPGVPSLRPSPETLIAPKPPLHGILEDVNVGTIGCIGLIVKLEFA
jgi:hypothetical protein